MGYPNLSVLIIPKVKLLVTKLTSTKTQMPYDYYSLPFCKPSKIGLQRENLGQVVSGDRVENSVYKVRIISKFSLTIFTLPK